MGKEIVVNKELLATILNLKNDGKTNPKADILDLAKMVFNDDNLSFAHSQTSKLGMFDRLLH